MKFIKNLTAAAVIASCANIANAATSETENLSVICGNVGVISAEVIVRDGEFAVPCELNPNITLEDGDALRPAYFGIEVTWVLNGVIKVGDGDQLLAEGVVPTPVELTVFADTNFRSLDASALVVTRGSKIFMNGTAEAPIVMASKDDNYITPGEWGGLVIQGYGVTNACDATESVCNVLAEGVSYTDEITGEVFNSYFGGTDNDDYSGEISHLIVAESGFDVAGSLDAERSGNEINGITLVGVGAQTNIANVQIVNGLDDGIEFFGGAVNVRDITIAGISDDSVDWDLGWAGKMENVEVMQIDRLDFDEAGNAIVLADHVIEASGNPDNFSALPYSNPVISNMSIVSTGTDEAIKLKEGTAGKVILTSVTLGTDQLGESKGCLEIEDAETQARITDGDLIVVSDVSDCQVGDQSFDVDPSDPFFTNAPADFSWALKEAQYNETL